MKGRGSMNALCPLMMEKVRHKSGRRHIGHFAAKMGERAGGMVAGAEGGGVRAFYDLGARPGRGK